MVGLPDIAPGSEEVLVGKHNILVTGVSAEGIVVLLERFPEVKKVMAGKTVDVERLLELAPEAIAAIIAAGVGMPGDEETQARARLYPVGTQADLLAAILRVTLPGGLRPFVAKLQALGLSVGVEEPAAGATSGKARASKSRKRSKR